MLTLVTGLPGACKTLFTLDYVQKKAVKENRQVYYSGIKELTLPWTLIEADKWMDVPDGSIIVMDEAQTLYRPRANGAVVPPYVALLETHRHRGLDIFVITQHPMLIDSNVRRLVGQHFHCVRAFGLQKSVIHEWQSVKENCDKNRADSTKHPFNFPKEVFGWYKSAEVHTHKRRLPPRLLIFIIVPLLIAGAVFGFRHWFSTQYGADRLHASGAVGDQKGGAPLRSSSGKIVRVTAAEYVESWQPRVRDLPYSAPAYDGVATAKTAPFPAACVLMHGKCRCYSQQATVLDVSKDFCEQVVAKGFFNPFDDPEVRHREESARLLAQGQQKVAAVPVPRPSGASDLPTPAAEPPTADRGLTPYAPRQPEQTPPYVQGTVPLGSSWRAK
ncbi:MAG: hypothetical protein JWQ04_96 [Pedosphaera sp.]|nr:hypothetical protein [Pedosphaera sp.]